MPEERITRIKTADGHTITIEYMTEEWQQPEELRRLAKSAAEAGRHAVQELLSAGIPAVFVEKGQLIRLYPDGHKEVIMEMSKS